MSKYRVHVWASGFNVHGIFSETVDLVDDLGYSEEDAKKTIAAVEGSVKSDDLAELKDYIFNQASIEYGWSVADDQDEEVSE